MQYVVFCDWLLSLSMFSKIHPCCSISTSFIFFCQIIFHFMDIPQFFLQNGHLNCLSYKLLYITLAKKSVTSKNPNEIFGQPIMLLWTFLYICFCVDVCFHFSWVYTYEWDFWVMWQCCVSLSEELLDFSKAATPFYTPLSNVWVI